MKQKILCADDEAGFRRIITMYMENQGYAILEAENGEQVPELLGKHPDTVLIILDVMMPVWRCS